MEKERGEEIKKGRKKKWDQTDIEDKVSASLMPYYVTMVPARLMPFLSTCLLDP
jgi:hypothetical protein